MTTGRGGRTDPVTDSRGERANRKVHTSERDATQALMAPFASSSRRSRLPAVGEPKRARAPGGRRCMYEWDWTRRDFLGRGAAAGGGLALAGKIGGADAATRGEAAAVQP